jgi:hypothetical protein
LSAKESEAFREPVADGVNVTLTVQAALGINVAPVQASALLAKSPALVPPIVTVEMARMPVPVLVIVTLWASLVVSRDWGENARPERDKAAELEVKAATRFETLTVPIPVAKSQPGPAVNAG